MSALPRRLAQAGYCRASGEVSVGPFATLDRRKRRRLSSCRSIQPPQGLGHIREATRRPRRLRRPTPPLASLPPRNSQDDELADDENNNRSNAAEAEVVEDDDEEEEEEEVAEAAPSRVSEILAQLQAAVEEGNGGDVLAQVLPELTTRWSGIESAFKDIQAANVGLEDQASAVKDQFLRLTADFDNFKKRTIKEKQQLGETAKSKVFEAMLPALDNFDLAKTNLKPESEEGEKIINQYQGLVDGLMGVLGNQGSSRWTALAPCSTPTSTRRSCARRARSRRT